MRKLMVGALVVLAAAACDEGTGLNGGTRVSMEFVTPSAPVSASVLGLGGEVARSMAVTGSNGVLTLDTVHVIVNELELERVGYAMGCDSMAVGDDDGDDDGCEEFEVPPSLVNLSLDGGTTTAVSAEIGEGEYGAVEFEVEDLEDDEDDLVERQQIEALRDSILAEFGEWPREASMRVKGTFTPTGGDPVPFLVFVEAEIEVELTFDSPFVVTADDVTRTFTVELSPSDWFMLGDGTVIDLSAYDWDTTGQVPEFEVEIENGFKSVEHDD